MYPFLKTSALFIVLSVLSWAQGDSRLRWQGPVTIANFPADVNAGFEYVGNRKRLLFICEAKYQGEWHLGKTAKDFSGCNIAYQKREIEIKSFFTLGIVSSIGLAWQPGKTGDSLDKAVSSRNQLQKVCRAKYAAGLHPGKYLEKSGCHIGYGGYERIFTQFEILVIEK